MMGTFEHEVMMTMQRLGGDPHGAAIWVELERRAGRNVAGGALYTTLNRLERKGYLSSYAGEATPERGGRPKKHYRIQAPGLEAMRERELRLSSFGNAAPEPA